MTAEVPSGFADECEEIALEVRAELGLRSCDHLDPRALAEHLAIEVAPLDLYRGTLPEEVARLTEDDPTALSAVTVFRGTRCKILINPEHCAEREANTIAHELAHVMLEHKPRPLFDGGERIWCGAEEDEANYLAGALLVPRDAVGLMMSVMEEDEAAVADHFGVSEELMARRIAQCTDSRSEEAVHPIVAELRDEAIDEEISILLSRLLDGDGDDDGEAERATSASL